MSKIARSGRRSARLCSKRWRASGLSLGQPGTRHLSTRPAREIRCKPLESSLRMRSRHYTRQSESMSSKCRKSRPAGEMRCRSRIRPMQRRWTRLAPPQNKLCGRREAGPKRHPASWMHRRPRWTSSRCSWPICRGRWTAARQRRGSSRSSWMGPRGKGATCPDSCQRPKQRSESLSRA